ncbi:hypothetical protein [Pseudomonas sp. SWRI99]|uniref:hypothetical protein n=1 Tax=Pseudomonas sp. SWRI99 TaxID=2745506 RepID=UPI001646F26D|nr:hypothetical protein [Pseudomonas sp. SWRI99]MBC3774837.1 hypothetical protein [Pseudomonas sp. SWRI99]
MSLTSDSETTVADSSSAALYAPDIPLLVRPLEGDEGYHGGIGAAALTADLLVIVDPWLGQELGDRCLLFWHDETTPVLAEIIDTPEKLGVSLFFYVPASQILDGTALPVFYRVRRHSGNEADSLKLKILVKRTLPGGVLERPEPLGHPGLRYSLIPDITNGIDSEMAKQGIVMRIEQYQNITVFDRIVAQFGDEEQVTYYPVTPEQISDPHNHPIEILFDEQLIKRAGDGKHSITFQVVDRCANRPHVNAPWAIATEANVRLKHIPAPSVTGEQAGVLDPAFVEKFEVVASGIGLVAGDSVRVHWQGRVEHETEATTYAGSGALAFPIPLEWANESDQSVVSIRLRVERSEEKLTSDAKTVNIKTTIILKPPKVLEAYGENGDRLKMGDIYEARHVTVQVQQYVGMAVGQTIRVRWASARHVYDSVITTVTAVGAMNITVPRMEVVDSIGSTVPVNFTVRTYPNGPLHRSAPLNLVVDAQAFVLPPPRFTQDQTTVTVYYPAIASGYQARVRFGGIVTRRTGWQNMQNGVIAEFSIPSAWVEENKGGVVLINYSVNRANVNEQSQFSQVLRVQL